MNWDNMDKSEIRHRLGRFLDGELPEEERRQTAELIRQNPDWQTEYNTLLTIRDMADRLELEADVSFWEKNRDEILDRIKEREKPEAEIVKTEKSNRRGMVIKLLAVAASIAIIAFVSIYEFETISPEKSLTSPQMRIDDRAVPVPETISKEEREQMEQLAEPEVIDSSYIMGGETGAVSEIVDMTDKDAVSINLAGGPEFRRPDRNEAAIQEFDKKEKLLPAGRDAADEAIKARTKKLPEKPPEPAIKEPSPEPQTTAAPMNAAKVVQPKAAAESKPQEAEGYSAEDLAETVEVPIQELNPQKLDSLDNVYYDLVSKHYQEMAVKGRDVKGDEEIQQRINSVASAYFLNGVTVKDSSTVQKMIARLENLADLSPDSAMRDSLIQLADSLRRLNR